MISPCIDSVVRQLQFIAALSRDVLLLRLPFLPRSSLSVLRPFFLSHAAADRQRQQPPSPLALSISVQPLIVIASLPLSSASLSRVRFAVFGSLLFGPAPPPSLSALCASRTAPHGSPLPSSLSTPAASLSLSLCFRAVSPSVQLCPNFLSPILRGAVVLLPRARLRFALPLGLESGGSHDGVQMGRISDAQSKREGVCWKEAGSVRGLVEEVEKREDQPCALSPPHLCHLSVYVKVLVGDGQGSAESNCFPCARVRMCPCLYFPFLCFNARRRRAADPSLFCVSPTSLLLTAHRSLSLASPLSACDRLRVRPFSPILSVSSSVCVYVAP